MPIAIGLVLLALAGSSAPAAAEPVGRIVGFRGDEIDLYDASGEFLCAVPPSALAAGAPADPCSPSSAAPARGDSPDLAIEEVTDDGQFRIVLGGGSFRVDPFQVDAEMNETPDIKPRCPQLAGRTEMAATRGLGESGCDSEEQ